MIIKTWDYFPTPFQYNWEGFLSKTKIKNMQPKTKKQKTKQKFKQITSYLQIQTHQLQPELHLSTTDYIFKRNINQ